MEGEETAREAPQRGGGRDTGEEREEETGGMKESRGGTKRRQGMEERGFIAAAGKSSVIAL